MVEKNKVTGYPKVDIPDSQKNEKYHLQWCKSIGSAISRNKSGIDQSMRNHFSLMRMYGDGNQPEDLYRDYKFGEGNIPNEESDQDGSWNNPGQGSREGYQHIDYTPVSPMPRIKDKLKGLLDGVDYNVYVDTIDEQSGAEKEEKKWKLWVQKEHGEFIKQLKQNADIPVQEPNYIPSTPYELELFEKVGGLKSRIAKAMEKLTGHTFEISEWDADLRDAIIDDLMDNGRVVVKVEIDPEDGKWKIRYVDLVDAILPYMRKYDLSEMPYAGHYEWMTIADLRQHVDMDEEKIANLAKRFAGKYNNPGATQWEELSRAQDDGSFGYESFRIKVMHLEWIDESQKKTMYYKNRYGKKSAFKLKDDEEPKPLSDKQKERGVEQRVETTNYRVLRQCSWVVDSDVVFDWGRVNFMDRPAKNKVIPSYIQVKLNNKPITERLRPVMDDIMIAWLKYQDGRAMAIKNGYAIDFWMMQNITDGEGNKFGFRDIIDMWREDGILIFQQSLNGRYEGGSVTPIIPIESMTGRVLQDAADMWTLAMRKIEDLTGLSPVALGASPVGETATGTELSVAATADILKPLINKMLTMKERIARSTMRRLQTFCVGDYIDVYEGAIGRMDIERLKQSTKGKTPVQFGMSFEAKPSEQDKQNLYKLIEQGLANRRSGQSGIDEATAAWAYERISHGGNLTEIRMILSYQIQKSQELLDQQKKEQIELQGQQNIALKQEEQKTKQQEIQGEMAIKQAEAQANLAEQQQEMMNNVLENYLKERPDEAKTFLEKQRMLEGNTQEVQEMNPPV